MSGSRAAPANAFRFPQFSTRGDLGKIYFDLSPSFDVVIPSLAGDFNNDGLVNAADYSVWRDSMGAMGSNLPADANNDGKVDQEDYLIWKGHFGQSRQRRGQSAVPEPSSRCLLLFANAASANSSSPHRLRLSDHVVAFAYFARSVRIVASLWSVLLAVNFGTTSAFDFKGMSIETVTSWVDELSVEGLTVTFAPRAPMMFKIEVALFVASAAVPPGTIAQRAAS